MYVCNILHCNIMFDLLFLVRCYKAILVIKLCDIPTHCVLKSTLVKSTNICKLMLSPLK